MFCYQCQEAAKNEGCTVRGVCGKQPETSDLQDLLIYQLKGIARLASLKPRDADRQIGRFISKALFATITNVNFDDDRFYALIEEAETYRKRLGGREHNRGRAG